MYRVITFLVSIMMASSLSAQVLNLDSCRSRALRANKQLGIVRLKHQVAYNNRKTARTAYLPHIDAVGGYLFTSKSISILNDDQKQLLGNLGNLDMAAAQRGATELLTGLVRENILTPQEAMKLGGIASYMAEKVGPAVANQLREFGQKILDAFETNTQHVFTASIFVSQPLYMGGKITATNRMADLAEKISKTNIEAKESDIIYEVDNAYWMVVSLKQKKDLADSYVSLVAKLDSDVHKMIDNGVATRADGLKVDVALNEAEMTQTRIDNGLELAKMYLCQLCGMDLHSDIVLEDQQLSDADIAPSSEYDAEVAYANRPELRMLSDAIEISKQQTKIARSGYLPQLALTGGILFTNPNMFNGFQRRFEGVWNVGVMLKVPILDWGGTMYKIRAAKHTASISQLTYDEAREKIDLQLSQCSFRMSEANKNLITARNNIASAEENLRCANLGFREGVISTTDVMSAQTAWLHAKTNEIDASIDVKLSETALKKAMGAL